MKIMAEQEVFMKVVLRRFLAVTAVLMLILSGTAGSHMMASAATSKSASAKETYEDAGYYVLYSMHEDGEELDLDFLRMLGLTGGLVLEEDGTGFLFIADDLTDLEWHDGVFSAEGEDTEYTIEDGIITLSEAADGHEMDMQFLLSDEEAPTREAVEAGEYKISDEELEANLMAGLGEMMGNLESLDFGGYSGSVKKDVVVANGIADMMAAIADNTTILLVPGTYNITDYIEANEEDLESWVWGSEDFFGYGVYKDEVFDGTQTIIGNVDGLTIMSLDPEAPAKIVIEPRYADVLHFENCNDLVIENVILGHTEEEGYCSGEVVEMSGCDNARFKDVELYGCGTYAFLTQNCDGLEIDGCYIHDCTYGCMDMTNTSNVVVRYSRFLDCQEFTMFGLTNSNADFIACTFRRLLGDMVSVGPDDEARFYFCNFDRDAQENLENNPAYGDQIYVISEEDRPKG